MNTSLTIEAVERIASEWVVRRGGSMTAQEEAELKGWLAADPRHAEAYARLEQAWAVFDRAAQKGATGEIAFRVAQRGRRRQQRRVSALAAAAAVVLGLFVYTRYSAPTPTPAEFKAESIVASVRKLPDGSIVELNQGAEINVQYNQKQRRVVLEKGEAHFRVAKDKVHPFLVQAGGVEVVAVGTAFTVQIAPRAVEVVVTEGRVAVAHDGATMPDMARFGAVAPTMVDAGSRALVDTADSVSSLPLVQPMTNVEMEKRLAWRASLLEFEGMELAEAVSLMNHVNRVQISFADESLGRLRVSGTFRADNPEGFVRIVGSTFDLKVEHHGDDRIVFRRP